MQLKDFKTRVQQGKALANLDKVKSDLEVLEPQVAGEGFWDDQTKAQGILESISSCKETVSRCLQWDSWIADAETALELYPEEEVRHTTPVRKSNGA